MEVIIIFSNDSRSSEKSFGLSLGLNLKIHKLFTSPLKTFQKIVGYVYRCIINESDDIEYHLKTTYKESLAFKTVLG